LIYNVLAFYFKNKADVDLYMTEVENELDRQKAAHEPSPAQLRIRGMMAERAALGKSTREWSIALAAGMPLDLPEFLSRHEKGEIRLTGHRIDLFDLVPFYNEGNSAEMLLGFFPTLSLALIHKVIAFYLENKAEVDAYVAGVESKIEQLRANYQPGPGILRIRKLMKEQDRWENATAAMVQLQRLRVTWPLILVRWMREWSQLLTIRSSVKEQFDVDAPTAALEGRGNCFRVCVSTHPLVSLGIGRTIAIALRVTRNGRGPCGCRWGFHMGAHSRSARRDNSRQRWRVRRDDRPSAVGGIAEI
jgi:uncharacterized protein (DUF433 family)